MAPTRNLNFGRPFWTGGVFGRASAADDLGLEDVGAGTLRRLIPGVISTTPNAGYYSFYPYLLWKWQQTGASASRAEYTTFHRRHEAAYAIACELHDHRGALRGVNGANRAAEAVRGIEDDLGEIDLDRVAESYMKSRLGGYALFYAAVLHDMRLVRIGGPGLVDRVTEEGEKVAKAFASRFEATEYFKKYFDLTGATPASVLRELGDQTCLCTIPARPDHSPLLGVFFGEELSQPAWEERRKRRVQSLGLLLDFHQARPAEADAGITAWRKALMSSRFADGNQWQTPFANQRDSWRAYQAREISVLGLTTIWAVYLRVLAERGRSTHAGLRNSLISLLEENAASETLRDASQRAQLKLTDGAAIVEAVTPLARPDYSDLSSLVNPAVDGLLALRRELSDESEGFARLLDEGGRQRWSLKRLEEWFAAHDETPLREAIGELVDEIHHQHVRIAISKVRVPSAENLRRNPGSWRDPFCFAEDEGELRPLRMDGPFWTGARYDVVNHLLWSLGLLDSPNGDMRPTQLGLQVLSEVSDA